MRTMLLCLSVLLIGGVAGCSKTPKDAMKPGLWETRIIKMEQDGKDITDTVSAAMARDPKLARICVTPEMANNMASTLASNPQGLGGAQRPAQAGCAQPKIDRSGNRTTVEVACSGVSIKSEIVVTSEQLTNKSEMVMTIGGTKHTGVTETQMNFVGSDCGKM